MNENFVSHQERPYQHDSTASRLLSEVKHVRAQLVLRWGTTLESWVLFFLVGQFFVFGFRPNIWPSYVYVQSPTPRVHRTVHTTLNPDWSVLWTSGLRMCISKFWSHPTPNGIPGGQFLVLLFANWKIWLSAKLAWPSYVHVKILVRLGAGYTWNGIPGGQLFVLLFANWNIWVSAKQAWPSYVHVKILVRLGTGYGWNGIPGGQLFVLVFLFGF